MATKTEYQVSFESEADPVCTGCCYHDCVCEIVDGPFITGGRNNRSMGELAAYIAFDEDFTRKPALFIDDEGREWEPVGKKDGQIVIRMAN